MRETPGGELLEFLEHMTFHFLPGSVIDGKFDRLLTRRHKFSCVSEWLVGVGRGRGVGDAQEWVVLEWRRRVSRVGREPIHQREASPSCVVSLSWSRESDRGQETGLFDSSYQETWVEMTLSD